MHARPERSTCCARRSCCETFDKALTGTSFVCALSARRRDLTSPAIDAHSAARELVKHALSAEAAIVFGPERVGLSIEDVSRCHRLVRIAANPEYSSLNVAAAVQIVAHELRCVWEADEPVEPQGTDVHPAVHEDVERLVLHLKQSMLATGFLDPARPGRLIQRIRRLIARAARSRRSADSARIPALGAWQPQALRTSQGTLAAGITSNSPGLSDLLLQYARPGARVACLSKVPKSLLHRPRH